MFERLKGIFEIGHTNHVNMYSMEGLRGFAVFLVFLVHYITLSEPWIKDAKDLFYYASLVRSLGNVGVDLFFVLSGYLIYGSLIKKEQSIVPYLRRRIERIYPTFSAVFCVYLLASSVFLEKGKIPTGFWEGIRYVCENYLLLPGMLHIEPLITVAWSLSYEFFFYLVVPIIIFSLRLKSWSFLSRIFLFLGLALAILVEPAMFGGHVRLAMFISGILLFEVSSNYSIPKHFDLLGYVALALAVVGTITQKMYGYNGQWKFAILFVSFFLLCLACFSMNGYISRTFRWTPLRWLGNISYSFYLIHGITLQVIFLMFAKQFVPTGNNTAFFWLGLVVSFPSVFIVSSLLFVVVEKPFSLSRKL